MVTALRGVYAYPPPKNNEDGYESPAVRVSCGNQPHDVTMIGVSWKDSRRGYDKRNFICKFLN